MAGPTGLLSALLQLLPGRPCSLCLAGGEAPRPPGGRAGRRRRGTRSPAPGGSGPSGPGPGQAVEAAPSTGLETLAHYCILSLLTAAAYSNAATGDFVHDDIAAIVTNEDALGKAPIHRLLGNDFWGLDIRDRRSHKSYRPLTVLSFRLTHALWGLSPLPFHLGNMLLHWAVTLLLHRTARTCLGLPASTSLIASALFAVHPVHTEAVSGIVGRADLLSTLLLLVTFLVGHRAWHRVGLVSLLAALATLAKETGVMALPVVMLFQLRGCRLVPLGKEGRRLGLQYTSITAAILLCRIGLNGSAPIFSEQDNPAAFSGSPLARALTYCYLAPFALAKLLCPATLSYDWQLGSIPLITSVMDLRNLATLAMVPPSLALLHTAWRSASPSLAFSLLTLGLPFLPASNIFFPVGFVAAERTLYPCSLGWSLLVADGCSRLLRSLRGRRPLALAAVMALVAGLVVAGGAATVARNSVWRSREALFRSGLSSTPTNGKVFYNFGNFLRDQERKDEARTCYKEALRLWPSYVIALNNLATVTDNETDIEALLLRALRLDSGHVTSLFNLADLYRQQGQCGPARVYFSLCRALPDCLPEAALLAGQCGGQGGEEGGAEGGRREGGGRLREGGGRLREEKDPGSLKVWEQCGNQSVPGADCRG